MSQQRLTRIYLETLSTASLISLADEWSLDIPPDLNRVFIIQELLEASAEDEDAPEPDDFAETDDVPEKDELPVSYNDTFIGVLLRDPIWAYAYWEIKAPERFRLEGDKDFDGYYLRICQCDTGSGTPEPFLVPVNCEDTSWYICLPQAASRCHIELCAKLDSIYEVITRSTSFSIPRGVPTDTWDANPKRKTLMELSGLKALKTIRNTEGRPLSLHQRACKDGE